MICAQCKYLAELDFAISTLRRLREDVQDCRTPLCDAEELKEYYLQLNKEFKETKEIKVKV